MKRVSRRLLAQTVVRQLLEGQDQKRLTKQLAAYLIGHGMTRQTDRLLQDIAVELERSTGRLSAKVTTAFRPTAHNLESLRVTLRRLTGAQEVDMTVTEDASLVGGMVVTMPGRELDASVRRTLSQLARGGE